MKNVIKKLPKKHAENLFTKVISLEKTAQRFGFYWKNTEQLWQQIYSECDEIKEALAANNQKNLKEEIGDLIHATLALSMFCKINPVDALGDSIEKYERRFNALIEAVKNDGYQDLKNQPTEILDKYWRKAKQNVG